MAFFNSNGVDLYYRDEGSGDPLIFLHGFTLDNRQWDNQAVYFRGDYRVILPDARGHGKSDAPETAYAREDRAADLLNLMDHLALEKAHVIGASMGGADAFSLALDHPERFRSLTLVGTTLAGWRPARRFIDNLMLEKGYSIDRIKEEFIKSVLVKYKDRNQKLHDRLGDIMKDFSGKPWADPNKGKYPVREELPLAGRIGIPVCLIIGKHDIMFMPLAEELDRRLPDSRLEVIPDAGHLVNMDMPQRFNAVLSGFLESQSKK